VADSNRGTVPRRSAGAGRAVLVTGAARGIGAACAVRLARAGFHVYAGVRRVEDGTALARAAGSGISAVLLDVTDVESIARAAARIDAEHAAAGLWGVVNNAGVAVGGPLEFLPLDELRRQLEVNVIGQIAVTQACLPLLRRARAASAASAAWGRAGAARAGRIVFLSSVSGRVALPFAGAYAASKFALEAAADALRVELAPAGIAVVLVEPGVITTSIWETAQQAGERNVERMPPAALEHYGRTIAALRARGQRGMSGLPPERVADAVAHALSVRRPRVRYVVGRDAHARIWLQRLLPVRVRDWLIGQVVRRL
jgi:NAD(P)-dependent dehydrogenase (short-subunit alcohol dehydrogenase family)